MEIEGGKQNDDDDSKEFILDQHLRPINDSDESSLT